MPFVNSTPRLVPRRNQGSRQWPKKNTILYRWFEEVCNNGRAELIAGGGPGGGPRVSSFAGTSLVSGGTAQRVVDFFAGDSNNRGGVRVAVKNLDGDANADLLTGAGVGAGSRLTAYVGKSLGAGTPPESFGLDALPGFTNGVFVG